MKNKPASVLWELIGRLANSTLTIRISGEEGVGKEAIAHLIYRHYPHEEADFCVIDGRQLDATSSPSDVEKMSKFLKSPQNSVMFIQNIEFTPQPVQDKLRELLKKKFTSRHPWILVASQRALEHDVADGRLSAPLFNVLDTLHITLPPLRSQPEKIPQILSWFLNHYNSGNPLSTISIPEIEELDRLTRYHWPGNWRQLQAVTHKAFQHQSWGISLESSWPNEKDVEELDSIAAIYILSMAKLSIQKSRVVESMVDAADQDELGLLDLAIFNEAVNQISEHIRMMDEENDDDAG